MPCDWTRRCLNTIIKRCEGPGEDTHLLPNSKSVPRSVEGPQWVPVATHFSTFVGTLSHLCILCPACPSARYPFLSCNCGVGVILGTPHLLLFLFVLVFVGVATGPTNERPVAPALTHYSLLTNTASILDWHLSIHSIPPGSLPTMPIMAVIYLNVSGSFSFRHIRNATVNSLRLSPLHYQLWDCTVDIYPPGL